MKYYKWVLSGIIWKRANGGDCSCGDDYRFQMTHGSRGLWISLREPNFFALKFSSWKYKRIAFIANEAISILENSAMMGVPIPKVLIKAIDVLKEKSNDKSNENEIDITDDESE